MNNTKKHTPVPRLNVPTITIDRVEYERSKNTLVERKASPEEMDEILAKYGPPIMPLQNRKGMPFPKKKKGGVA